MQEEQLLIIRDSRVKKKLGLAIQKCKGVQEEYMALVIDAMLLEKKLNNFKVKIIRV